MPCMVTQACDVIAWTSQIHVILLDNGTGRKCLSIKKRTTDFCGIKYNWKGDQGTIPRIECQDQIQEEMSSK